MTIFYKGLIGTQSPEYGIEVKNINGFVLLHYSTENVIYDTGDIMFCIEEYIEHCNKAVQYYYNWVSTYARREWFPDKNYYEPVRKKNQAKSDKIDAWTFVSSHW